VKDQLAESVTERRSLARALLVGEGKAQRRDVQLGEQIRVANSTLEEFLRHEIAVEIEREEAEERRRVRDARSKQAEQFAEALGGRGGPISER
jgi:hypothetical protein